MSRNNRSNIIAEPGKQEILIIQEYDAPRELVFQAYTDPELYAQWVGPRSLKMTIIKFEPKNGGMWRYIHREQNGNEYAFEGLPESGHVILESVTFEERPGGKTRVTGHSVFLSVADRDGMLYSGLEEGVNDSYNRLTELLANMRK